MPFHHWNDNDFDWASFYKAIDYCMTNWQRWGRIGTHGKEKYGTFRDHTEFWDGSIFGLIYPGYCYIKPKWYYIKTDFVTKFFNFIGLVSLMHRYQAFVYNYCIQQACKKYPHLVDELVSDLDHYYFIKPGFFGPIDGTVIHKKYWTRV